MDRDRRTDGTPGRSNIRVALRGPPAAGMVACVAFGRLGTATAARFRSKCLGIFLVEQAFTSSLAQRRQINLQKIYTALLTADLMAAEAGDAPP